MPRELKPENSLAALLPTVAATWHPDRNGERTPENTSTGMSYRAWWRCPAGHEWDEIVATRNAMPGWKNGDVAACRVCTGHHVIATFDCGHTAEAPWQYAEPERGCPPCRKARSAARQAEYQQRRAENSAKGAQAYAEAKDEAAERVAALGVPHVPAPLVFEWRNAALHALRAAIVDERTFGRAGRISHEEGLQRQAAAHLLPTEASVADAVATRKPVLVAGKAHWATGWQYWLALRHGSGQPASRQGVARGEELAPLTELEAVLLVEVARAQKEFGGQARVASVTRWLTETIAGWAYEQEKAKERRWNVFRELSVPLAPTGSERFGRLDLTVIRPDRRDFVIEIDSVHKASSVEKLAFARDAGSLAVWVRWKGGRVERPEGVLVIDLVAATKGLTA